MCNCSDLRKLIRLLKELEKLEAERENPSLPITVKEGQTTDDALGDYLMKVEAEIHYVNEEIDDIFRRL